MSSFGYRSKSGCDEGSHSDYVKGRPIISYDAARGTYSYVTRIEPHADTSYKHPTSHVMVDPLMEKYGRPREVEEFITKILDEVNGAPDSPKILNLNPNQGRHSSPVKVDPASDHGYDDFTVKSKIFGYHGDPSDHVRRPPGRVYDQPPRKDYGVPNGRYFDQSHRKSETSKDYEAPRQWERSQHPLYHPPSQHELKDPGYPKNQGGNSSIKFRAPKDHEVPKRHPDKSSSHVYDGHFPKYQYAEMSKDYGGTNSRWHNSIGRPQSPNNHGIPSNHRLSSYDRSSLTGNVGGAPKNYDELQFPDNYGLSNNQHERSSSPLHDHSPTSGYIAGVPNSKWGNSWMKPQSPRGHGALDNQWRRSSSPIHDHSPFTKSTSDVTDVPSNQWGHSSMKPQSPKNHYPPARSTRGALNAPTSQWGNSLMKPQPSDDHGEPGYQWNRSSSPVHDHPPLAKTTTGSPTRWGNNSMKPVSSKDHGAPNSQWDGSSNRSFVTDHPLPSKNKGGVPNNQWPHSPTKSESQSPKDYGFPHNQGNKQSSFVHGEPPVNGNIGGVPNKRWSDHSATPQSPKGYNQWNRSSSPVHDHSPTWNTTGIPNSKLGNSSMKPQSPKKANNPYDEKTGSNNNNNTHMNKPVGYTNYDHQPEEYRGSNNGTKPNSYSNPPKMDPASATQKPLAPDNLPDPRLKFSYPSSVGPKPETKVGPGYINNAERGKRYDGHGFPAKPSQVRT